MEALRILPPNHLVGAVEALPLIERLSQVLADRGALYELDRDVYFSRASDPAFGAVSHLGPATMLALCAERGGDPARPGKKDPIDPLVWLAARPGEPSWESPFGPGRPGWHVECAAIATSYLGRVFDVQAGGSDLIFPHHEFSASHARVAFADGAAGAGDGVRAFARCYAHSGMVRLDGEKMSKSLGNLVLRVSPGGGRRRPDGGPAGDHGPPLPGGLGLDGCRAGRRAGAAGELARRRDPGDFRAGAVCWGRGPGPSAGDGSPVPSAGGAGPGLSAGDAGPVPSAEAVLAGVRERIADDLDAPGALGAVDRWAAAVNGAAELPPGSGAAAELVRDTVDALLGVAL